MESFHEHETLYSHIGGALYDLPSTFLYVTHLWIHLLTINICPAFETQYIQRNSAKDHDMNSCVTTFNT
jgi:hypothetical protein